MALKGALLFSLDPVIIEPDLADGDNLWMRGKLMDFVKRGVVQFINLCGMKSNRGIDDRIRFGQFHRLRAGLVIESWNEDPNHPGVFGALNHLGAVIVEFMKIQMAMGIC